MAGTIVAGTLSDGTYSGSVTDTVRGACKAWVNFNGTGTVAIRASYNVSSITDNGTGNYTVNFATALPDANYCGVVSAGEATWSGPAARPTIYAANNISASSFPVAYSQSSTLFDPTTYMVSIFR